MKILDRFVLFMAGAGRAISNIISLVEYITILFAPGRIVDLGDDVFDMRVCFVISSKNSPVEAKAEVTTVCQQTNGSFRPVTRVFEQRIADHVFQGS